MCLFTIVSNCKYILVRHAHGMTTYKLDTKSLQKQNLYLQKQNLYLQKQNLYLQKQNLYLQKQSKS